MLRVDDRQMAYSRSGVALFAASAVLLLTGCSDLVEEWTGEVSREFGSAAELADDWNRPVSWLPEDATRIRLHHSLEGSEAVLGAISATALDPAVCAETARQSGPAYTREWSPWAYLDRAWACGEWTVIATDDGWYGWTPSGPDEMAASPSSG